MGFIKRKIKKFDYEPRYYKGEGNPYEVRHKFDEFRTIGKSKGIKAKINQAVNELRDSESRGINNTILIIVLILVFIFLYIIDFDLSIFVNN